MVRLSTPNLARGLRAVESEVDMKYPVLVICAATVLSGFANPACAQLSLQWMVPASANTPGHNGTDWHTDVSLHNPQAFDLPVMIQFLPSETDNQVADTLYLTLYPWETFNLWDVLGPGYFDVQGTGAILVIADESLDCEPPEDCDFLVTSRTYTLAPGGAAGEFGQTIPGAGTWSGIDWNTLGYAAGILNDGIAFRTNIGFASWSWSSTTVAVDVQDADGNIIDSLSYEIPPFGHLQRRLPTVVEGGSVVMWIAEGDEDPLVFGYLSIVDERTGDASYQLAEPSVVGFGDAKSTVDETGRRAAPRTGRRVDVETRMTRGQRELQ
jgi:hypothetical protein